MLTTVCLCILEDDCSPLSDSIMFVSLEYPESIEELFSTKVLFAYFASLLENTESSTVSISLVGSLSEASTVSTAVSNALSSISPSSAIGRINSALEFL